MLVKPNGRLGRYLHGIEYSPTDVKLGLLEVSEGKSISTIDKVVMYCYRYDPKDRKYVVVANRVMRIGGGLTVLVLGGFLGMMWRGEQKKRKAEGAAERERAHDAAEATE